MVAIGNFEFINSEYFVPEIDNWHIKEGAPPEIVASFNEYLKLKEEEQQTGKTIF